MFSQEREEGSAFSPMQTHFLKRLRRVLKLRNEQGGKLNEGGLRLIDRAIYTTYCDAADCGVTVEAQQLLQQHAMGSRGSSTTHAD